MNTILTHRFAKGLHLFFISALLVVLPATVGRSMEAAADNVIATSGVPLDGRWEHIRSRETNEGNLVADSFLWKAMQLYADHGAPAPDIAMSNGGGIRNDSIIPLGPITEQDTFDMLPWPNFLTIVPDVTPEEFQALLENAVSRINAAGEPEGSGTGRFAQIAGFRFTYDSRLDVDSRVSYAALNDGTVMIEGGAIAPTARNVNVAIVDFLAQGGDDYFGGPPGRTDFFNLDAPYRQALVDYLQAPGTEGGLGGFISAAQYPWGGEGRIVNLVLGPIGGIVVPVDKLGLVAPWMGLVALAGIAALGVVLVRRRRD